MFTMPSILVVNNVATTHFLLPLAGEGADESTFIHEKSASLIMLISLFICMIFFLIEPLYASTSNIIKIAEGLLYENRKEDNHIFHILTLDPRYFELQVVKAKNQLSGRETVTSMVQQNKGIAGINAGFFQIGNNQDGHPAGTLIIQGNPVSLGKGLRSLLLIDAQGALINRANAQEKIIFGQNTLIPNQVNRIPHTNDIVLYNSFWGSNSPDINKRKELIFDKDHTVIQIVPHGNNNIPPDGMILSFPETAKFSQFKIGQRVKFNLALSNTTRKLNGLITAVMGIPMLVTNRHPAGGIAKSGTEDFVMQPHARTAIGLRKNHDIIMVVVEHPYASFSFISNKAPVLGLTLPELAQLMINLECEDAINLDGGGSSSMVINGQMVNTAMGDKDESLSIITSRPVSDAIIVRKRTN